jgi:hypothetical protein
MIKKEALEKRLSELRQQEATALANLHAVGGAIQDCMYWIKQLEEGDDTDTSAE